MKAANTATTPGVCGPETAKKKTKMFFGKKPGTLRDPKTQKNPEIKNRSRSRTLKPKTDRATVTGFWFQVSGFLFLGSLSTGGGRRCCGFLQIS